MPGAKAALAVITERPNRSKGTWGPVDALVRFDGELVVDVETSDDFDWGIDYDDETDSNLELPLVVAPLRVSLFEVAALRSA